MIWHAGHHYGTADQIAHHLGDDITPDRVRDWARRSRQPGKLHGLLPGHHQPGQGRGTTWYRLDQAAHVEMLTRTARCGRQRAQLTPAA